jgi:hypothetical protein
MYRIKRIIRRVKYFPKFIKEAFSWEYESCKRCGSIFRIVWNVDDKIWQKVMEVSDDGGGSLCIDCFVKIAESKGIIIKPEQINIKLFYPEK